MIAAEIASALDDLLLLEPNWDSYGSVVIDPRCVERARRFLEFMQPPPKHQPAVVPCSGGGVQLEWAVDGMNMEIEFCPGGTPGTEAEHLTIFLKEDWE